MSMANTHIYTTLIIVITASILTVFGFLDGWSRERGEYDDELLFHRILKVIYAIISYVASWFIWKHGRKLHKLAKNRANVMEQFPQRGRNLTPLVIAPMLESSPDTKEIDFSTSITGQQNAKQLRHSQFRLDTINWAILIGGTAFGSFALLYAAILPEVVTRPGLNLLFHLLLNVLTTLIFLLMMIILVFSVTYQRELERQKAEAYQKTANDGTCPYSYNDNLSICTRNTLDMVEASRLSAAIATLQAEVRLEPLMVVEHSLAPATQPRQFDSLNARDSLTPSSSRRVRDDWMYCALQARDSIAK
ncbi:hypothetical protein BDF19DRAFT_440314 [Syncephalis fuscata]|nr:hypothetical protein BDF19DRAFT_440314 [Syncephalis fuscata]